MKFKEIIKYTNYTPKEVEFLDFCADLVKTQKAPQNIHQIDLTMEVVNTNIMHALGYVNDFDTVKNIIEILEERVGKEKVFELAQKEQKNTFHLSFLSKIFSQINSPEICKWAFEYLPKPIILKEFLDEMDDSTKSKLTEEELKKYKVNFLHLYIVKILSTVATKTEKIDEFIQTLLVKDFTFEEIKEQLNKIKSHRRISLDWKGEIGFDNFLRFILEPKLDKLKIKEEIILSKQSKKTVIL